MFSVCGETDKVIRFIEACINSKHSCRLWRWHCDKWLRLFARAIEDQVDDQNITTISIISNMDGNFLILYLRRKEPVSDVYALGTGFYLMRGRPFSKGEAICQLRGDEYWGIIRQIVNWYSQQHWRAMVKRISKHG